MFWEKESKYDKLSLYGIYWVLYHMSFLGMAVALIKHFGILDYADIIISLIQIFRSACLLRDH